MSSNVIYTDRIPFAYLIGWKQPKMYYYGVRYAKGCAPSDLWTTYFTSSRGGKNNFGHSVQSYRALYGEPDIVEVRRTFLNKDTCVEWERRFLQKVKARTNPIFLNKTEGIFPCGGTTGYAAAKLSTTQESIGMILLTDVRWGTGEIVSVHTGTHHKKPESFKVTMSKIMRGRTKSREHIENRAKTVTAKNELGRSIMQDAAKKALTTKAADIVDGINMSQRASIKAGLTKTAIHDDGTTIAQRAAQKAKMKTQVVGEDGLTSRQRAAVKRSHSMSYEMRCEASCRAAATKRIPDADGVTPYEKSANKSKLTKIKNSRRFDVMHIDGRCIHENVTLNFVRKLSASLPSKMTPETAIGVSAGKGSCIVQRFINQNKSHLLGLYIIERYSHT